jgi:hypothetical protein
MDGLELSTDKLDLAAPDRCDLTLSLTLSDFHKISRAAAALRDRWDEKARCSQEGAGGSVNAIRWVLDRTWVVRLPADDEDFCDL